MKRFLLLLIFAFGLGYLGWGQVTLPHLEQFNYTAGQALQTQSGWTAVNTGDDILISAGNLSYPDLQASTGNKVAFDGIGIDAYKAFTSQNSNTVYFSFILNVTALSSLNATGGYFTGLATNSSTFGATVWTGLDGTGYKIGINPRTSTTTNMVWVSGTQSLNTSVLVVGSYQFVAGNSNDVVNIWINPSSSTFGNVTPPTVSATATNLTGTDLTSIAQFFLRQDSNTETPFIEMDEFRVGTTWADVTPSGGSSPSIALSDNGTQVSAGNLTQGTNNNILSTFKLDVTTANATLTSASFLTEGNYQAADINGNGFKLWYNATNDFATASSIGTAQGSTSTGSGDLLTFASLTQTINSGSTGYFWVSANIAAVATVGRTINLTAIANADLTFSSGTKSGSASAGGTQTIIAPVSPTIFTSGSLIAFTAISGTPSASQSYTVSGDNLTANVLVSAPTKYEVSTDDISFSNTVDLTQSGGNIVGEPKTVYVRISATASVGAASGDIAHTSAGATTVNVAVTGTVYAPEPTNHPTTFTATANSSSQITLIWADANVGQLPDAYLVKAAVDPSSPTAPVDGTAEVNAALVKNITQGTQTAIFTGLSASTTYNFSIWPYTNSGTNIDYKIGSQPTANATTQVTASIRWDGGASTTAWTDANNWSDNIVPTAADNVVLDNSLLAGSYSIELPSGAVKTTINKLTITPTLPNTITLTLPVTNTYGASGDAGFVIGDNTASTDDIIINEGGILVNASGGSSGNGIQVNALANGTCRINNGGKYKHSSGRSTAGIVPLLSSVAGTETGIYEYDVPGTSSYGISASGRNYGSLVLTRTAGAATYTSSGASALTLRGNLLINSGITYTTTMSGAFNIAGNISNNGSALTIAASQAVNFNGTSTQLISGSSNITFAGAVTIGPSSSVQIAPNIGVTISGVLTNNAGTSGLVIKSDAAGTGSLLHNSAAVNATIERYVTGSTDLNADMYHFVSVPLEASNNPQAGLFTGSYLSYFDQPTQSYLSASGSGVTTPLDVTRGYMIYYPNPSTTYSFAGTMNNGSFTTNTSHYSVTIGPDTYTGFNLVPNPYPSAIDWDAASGWTKTLINDAIWIWNPTAGNYAAYGVDAGVNSGTRYIPQGQSFFIQSNSASPELSMNNSVRVHNTQAFYKSAESSLPELLRIKVDCEAGTSDEIVVRFNSMASIEKGLYDVAKLTGSESAPQLYTLTGSNEQLSINALPHSTQTIVVPVGIEYPESKSLTFTANGIESFESSVNIFLEDKLLNKTIDLRENPVYTFINAAGADPMRFNLLFYGVNSSNELSAANHNIWVNNDKINVLISDLIGQKAIVELIDQQGRIINTISLTLDSPFVIQAPVSSGLYIVRVVSGKQAFTTKVFIR